MTSPNYTQPRSAQHWSCRLCGFTSDQLDVIEHTMTQHPRAGMMHKDGCTFKATPAARYYDQKLDPDCPRCAIRIATGNWAVTATAK